MMEEVRDAYDVGVIVGRFQVPSLHQAHRDLIEYVLERHEKAIIFLGVTPLRGTRKNPLDFEARKQMILAEYPSVNVLYVKDQYLDEVWSRELDERIGDLLSPSQNVVLYGGRDSFISHYHGRYPTQELQQTTFLSGNAIRAQVAKAATVASDDFRAGAVWQAFNRFPTMFSCVDIAIFNEDFSSILLGRKAKETRLRLIGGFVDVTDSSLEAAARRETMEEATIDVTDPVYAGSFPIPDWRYRGEIDNIMTTLWVCQYRSGKPTPADDIAELRWLKVGDLNISADIMPNHHGLVQAAIKATRMKRGFNTD